MHVALKSQILGGRQSHLGRNQTLHHRVVCQIQEHGHVLVGAALVEGTTEEIRHVMLDAHGGEHDAELLVGIIAQGRLLYQLGRQLIVGQAVAGENRQLLAADQGGQAVDGGKARPDIIAGVFPHDRIQWLAVHIPVDVGHDLAQTVDGLSQTVKGTAQDLRREGNLHGMAGQLRMGVAKGHIVRAAEHLNDRLVLVALDDAPQLFLFSVYRDLHNLLIGCVLDAFQGDQRAIDFT